MDDLGRLSFIDCLRGIAIVLMIQQHFALVLMNVSLVDSIPYTLMVVLGEFSGPMFFLLVGMSLLISLQRRRSEGETETAIKDHVVSRGIIIAIIGFAFMFIWQNDTLNYIGFFILATYPVLKFSIRARVILGAVTTVSSLFETYFLGYIQEPFFEWQVFRSSWVSSKVIQGTFGNRFPVMLSSLSLVIFGTVFGSLLIQSLQEGHLKTFQTNLLKLGSILVSIGASKVFWNIPFDSCPTLYVTLTMGVALLLLSALIWLMKVKRKAPRFLDPLLVYGKLSLSIYIGHIVIWLGVCNAFGLLLQLSLPEVLVLLFSCYVSTWMLGVLWLKIKKEGPLELLVCLLYRGFK
jgi:uncharacterized membrane protein